MARDSSLEFLPSKNFGGARNEKWVWGKCLFTLSNLQCVLLQCGGEATFVLIQHLIAPDKILINFTIESCSG